MTPPRDIPFDDLANRGLALIARGARVHFKWTCAGCGSRQTFKEVNALYTIGTCEECKHETSLLKQGGGMLVAFPLDSGEWSGVEESVVKGDGGSRTNGEEAS